jgi:hypothetical protein
MPEPFMEHPTGEFDTSVAAMEDAIRRLRALPSWEQWITFAAQGKGQRPDNYHFAEIRMRGDSLDLGDTQLDVARILGAARAGRASLVRDGLHYSVSGTSPREAAQILDAIFRHHFGIRPFDGEGDDYAVGAEW